MQLLISYISAAKLFYHYSPYTVTVAGLDSAIPPLLLATHLYTPSSDSVMLVIFSILELPSGIDISSLIHW